jgi:hypothetical protein
MNRVSDVKKYITEVYPALSKNKFDIAKIGARIYIYLVDRNGSLQRELIFRGSLPAVNEMPVLKKHLESTIRNVMKKWNYC